MTEELFRKDAYLKNCNAMITAVENDKLFLDQTVFYPMGGGQPGDRGELVTEEGVAIQIIDTLKSENGEIAHISDSDLSEVSVGSKVTAAIDWQRRYRLMRVHTLLHVLCSVVDADVTGGAIRDNGTGRLDFDLPETTIDKIELGKRINTLVQQSHPTKIHWISVNELNEKPELVRTMSVKPPMTGDTIRLLEIEDIDLQACGGTHLANINEIGEIQITKVEKKGRQNRRVNIALTNL